MTNKGLARSDSFNRDAEEDRMDARFHHILLMPLAVLCMGAAHRTPNFRIEAPDTSSAQQVGKEAERLRKQLALAWLGKELPTWQQPCDIQVKITVGRCAGATSQAFDNGRVVSRQMCLEGLLEKMLSNTLPHEMTHVILGQHFGKPVPRWFDEGAAGQAEGPVEIERFERLWDVVSEKKKMPLRRLFGLADYPSWNQIQCFYAQSYSVTRFLLARGNRQTLVACVGQGMRDGWDKALQQHYGHRTVEELEKAWLGDVRRERFRSELSCAIQECVDGYLMEVSNWSQELLPFPLSRRRDQPPPPAASNFPPSRTSDFLLFKF
jgi:hypothetical protein